MARKRLGQGPGGGGHGDGNAERWLLTYADMITLLTAFFIMMYSMSVLNLAKFNQMATSIRSGFGGTLPGQGHSVLNTSGGTSLSASILPEMGSFQPAQVVRQMDGYLREHELQNEVQMSRTDHGVRITLRADGKVLFPKGQAGLTPEAAQVLQKVASVIAKTDSDILVEGHTDDLPIRTARFPSNWELSTARAATVVRYLIEKGRLEPTRLSAAGYADSKPLVPNISESHRAANRRVEIIITQREPEPSEPTPRTAEQGETHMRPSRTPRMEVREVEATPHQETRNL